MGREPVLAPSRCGANDAEWSEEIATNLERTIGA